MKGEGTKGRCDREWKRWTVAVRDAGGERGNGGGREDVPKNEQDS